MTNQNRAIERIESVIDSKIDKAIQNVIGSTKQYAGRVTSIDSDGTIWVSPVTGGESIPCTNSGISVSKDNLVYWHYSDGRAIIDSDPDDPAASSSTVQTVEKQVIIVGSDLDKLNGYVGYSEELIGTISDNVVVSKNMAEEASTAAEQARTSANQAVTSASQAQTSANQAISSAAQANTYATSALDQLSIVQDVVGVLDYASQNGSFSQTSDTTVQSGKVYFTYDSETHDYVPVVAPSGNPHDNGYFELTYEDPSMGDFIMSHLAVTSRGLWVLPSGIGSSTTPASGETQADSDARQGSGYKMLLSSGGSYIYDSAGALVRSDTAAGTEFASGKDWYMGGQNAYIFYDASEGTINIGGSSVVIGGSKTLSELVSEVDSTLIFKIDESYNAARTAVVCTAKVLRGGEDIVSEYPASCFAWYIKSEGGTYPLEPLGTGYSMTVSLAEAGYGAAVKCHFTPPNDAALLNSDDDSLTDSNDAPLSVRSPSGDYVRVADLSVETTVFDTDKLMVVGSEDEHLVSIETLKSIFGDNNYNSLLNRPQIEDITLSGNKDFSDLGIFQTDGQGYSVPDDYTMTSMEINTLWANAVAIG